jgi:hypothetical protein
VAGSGTPPGCIPLRSRFRGYPRAAALVNPRLPSGIPSG